jgi:hypothetical protein
MVAWSLAVGMTKITSSDPPLLTVRTAYPSPPLQTWPPLSDPPIKLTSWPPCGCLDLYGWVDGPPISLRKLL